MATTAHVFPSEQNMKRTKFDLPLNERLKTIRKRRNMSLTDVTKALAKSYGIKTATSTIQGYEASESNQNHRYPNAHVLLNLANLYNCSLDYIFGLTDEIELPTGDIYKHVVEKNVTLWKGKPMSDAQKMLLIEKGNTIMNI